MSDAVSATTPRSRTPRAEGMANMVEATIRLLQQHQPDDITVRDVAEASGHHHRFVQAWFGGKVGLFRAVFDHMTQTAALEIRGPSSPHDGFVPGARVIAGLMNWLMAADPDSLSGPRAMPIVERLTELYRKEFGFEPELARLMALRVVSASIAVLLFGGPLGIGPDDVNALAGLELELTQLLLASRTAG
jgi:AcrR family transcriptional regulator